MKFSGLATPSLGVESRPHLSGAVIAKSSRHPGAPSTEKQRLTCGSGTMSLLRIYAHAVIAASDSREQSVAAARVRGKA